jgi:hypothetical protein
MVRLISFFLDAILVAAKIWLTKHSPSARKIDLLVNLIFAEKGYLPLREMSRASLDNEGQKRKQSGYW